MSESLVRSDVEPAGSIDAEWEDRLPFSRKAEVERDDREGTPLGNSFEDPGCYYVNSAEAEPLGSADRRTSEHLCTGRLIPVPAESLTIEQEVSARLA